MAINKVVFGGETVVDLTEDTVDPTSLADGVTAHAANGEKIVGVMPTTTVLYTEQDLTDDQKAQARTNIGVEEITNELSGHVDDLNNELEVERQRINQFTALEAGSTTGDAELQDIRVGANGTTYATAGEAVRAQYNEIPRMKVSETEPTTNNVEFWIDPTADEEYNIPEINDEIVSEEDTWSSQKINEEVSQISSENAKLKSDISESTRNKWTLGNQSFTKNITLDLESPLPSGTYTFSAKVVSNDTDSTTCRVQFYDGTNNVNGQIARGDRVSVTITTDFDITKVILNASNSSTHSSGDIATFANIQIENGSVATDYIAPLSAKDVIAREMIEHYTTTVSRTVNILGDSITYGVGASDTDHRYANLLTKYASVTVNNYGLSSSKISEIDGDSRDSFVERVSTMDTTADMVIVFGGTNDYWHNSTDIGTPTDTDTLTLCGALNYIMPYLLTNYPNKEIVFVTPYKQYSNTLGGDSDTDFGRGNLKQFVDAIIERAEYYSIPVIDLYRISGMDMAHNTNHRQKFGNTTSDCVHPNNNGHDRIARKIAEYINSIIWAE